MKQNDAILAHLQTGQTITPMLAYELFGVLACHSRISELRKAGHSINCSIRSTDNGRRYGEYTLLPRPEQAAA